jgi:hypothetical protein
MSFNVPLNLSSSSSRNGKKYNIAPEFAKSPYRLDPSIPRSIDEAEARGNLSSKEILTPRAWQASNLIGVRKVKELNNPIEHLVQQGGMCQ